MLTSCIRMSPMFGRLGIDRPWCVLLNEEAFFWYSPKHLRSQTLIHPINQGKALIRGIMLLDHEKSDKTKTEVSNFASFNVDIIHHNVSNVQLAQHWSTVMWSIEWRRFSLMLSQTSWISISNPPDWLGWHLDQRCIVNLIMRSIPLRIIFLQESAVDRHHEGIIARSYKTVCSI